MAEESMKLLSYAFKDVSIDEVKEIQEMME